MTLFGPAPRRPRWRGTRALTTTNTPRRCDNCETATRLVTVTQPALVRHAGHGETTEADIAVCESCWTTTVIAQRTTRPTKETP